MRRLAAALAILMLGLAAAPVAWAQIGPNVPSPLTEPPPPPAPAPRTFDDGGLSTRQKLLIFGSAALVLAGIAFVIVRDARRSAPVDERPRGAADGPGGASVSARERERQQRAKRAKAKAARQQRKRNRPR